MQRKIFHHAVSIALLALPAAGCAPRSADTPAPAMPARDTVVISDPPYSAYVGRPVTLAAHVWQDGVAVPGAPVQWTVSPASIASVATDGTLTPLAEGHITITARTSRAQTKRTLLVRRR